MGLELLVSLCGEVFHKEMSVESCLSETKVDVTVNSKDNLNRIRKFMSLLDNIINKLDENAFYLVLQNSNNPNVLEISERGEIIKILLPLHYEYKEMTSIVKLRRFLEIEYVLMYSAL
jgi:hypothetical protein